MMREGLRRRRWGRWRGIPNPASGSIPSARLSILSTKFGSNRDAQKRTSRGTGYHVHIQVHVHLEL